MTAVTITNKNPMAIGVWDVNKKYRVARAMGGVIVVEPSFESERDIEALVGVGGLVVSRTENPALVSDPTVSGDPTVGQTLTLDPGEWVSAESLAYQWEIAGSPVSGADELTFVLPPESSGQWVTAVVTATGRDGTSTTVAETDQFGPIGA